ncbi:MAG: transglycosylase domain-containing protein [Bacteroidia bacterium]|nr:transglycosylase domain-containing protein [Bacteroidia bacterium]MBP6656770.1 transglycosylase domain-containing protein [Bacteroidia bacterium]
MEKIFKRILKVAIAFFVGLLLIFFIFRNPLLHYITEKVGAKMKEEKGLTMVIGSSSFSGLFTVALGSVSIIPQSGDTLLHADTLRVQPSIAALLTGTIRLNQVEGSGILLQLVHKKNSTNYKFASDEKKAEKTVSKGSNGYSGLLARVLDRSFNFAPQKAEITNAILKYKNDTLERLIRMNRFHSDVNSLKGEFEDLNSERKWECSGSFHQSSRKLDLFLFPTTEKKSNLPLVTELTGATISFDTVHIELDGYRYSNKELKVFGLASVSGFSFHHNRISEDSIKVENASISYTVTTNENSLMLDSSSVARLSGIVFKPYLRFETSGSKKYALRVETDTIPATDFFNSLPQGMFDEVRSIEADGSLKFKLNFFLDSANPDNVTFDCSMKKNKFRIRKFNNSDLMKMSGEFTQSVYDYGRYVRSFIVGPSNPYYTPYEGVSPYFRNSVLTSEDGNFFYHYGFNEDAFRKSIATNYKAKKFLRGGSTISMQLVKNIYLNRKKTIARKAEEALIVWLIESNRLYSKERMLEVYFNIIELGPNIYGIGEASEFYFKKTPAALTLPESIFLASLLPHPKWFRYSFDPSGNLKPYLANYYKNVSNFMLRKQMITEQERDNLFPNVQVTGRARDLIMPNDTILVEEEEIF